METNKKNIQVFVHGKPAPGGSKKGFYIKKLKRVIMAPASDKTKPWMQAVAGVVKSEYQGELLTGPLLLKLRFQVLRPNSHFGSGKNEGVIKLSAPKYPTVKPDLTKLIRATEDALTGILWKDDSQIVKQETEKVYVTKHQGVLIEVFSL